MMSTGLFVIIWIFKLVVGNEEGFIVGGDYVDSIKRFPHVAFLTLVDESGDEYLCGSSILDQFILISAAHCFDNVVSVTASVGSVDRETGKMYRATKWRQHEHWNTKKIINDVALCRLKKPITFGQTVKRVVLMKKPPRSRLADVAGWGAHEEQDYSDTIRLKHTRQKLWTHNKCQSVLNSAPKGTICGGERSAKGDFVSRGDSGSGLLVDNKIIVGLVSYKDTSVSRSLVIYTDVAYFYNWIVHMAKRLRCS